MYLVPGETGTPRVFYPPHNATLLATESGYYGVGGGGYFSGRCPAGPIVAEEWVYESQTASPFVVPDTTRLAPISVPVFSRDRKELPTVIGLVNLLVESNTQLATIPSLPYLSDLRIEAHDFLSQLRPKKKKKKVVTEPRTTAKSQTKYLQPEELQNSRVKILRLLQRRWFLDNKGLLLVGGRLRHANFFFFLNNML